MDHTSPEKRVIQLISNAYSVVFNNISDPTQRELARQVLQTMYELRYYSLNPELTIRKSRELIERTDSLIKQKPKSEIPAPLQTLVGDPRLILNAPSDFSHLINFEEKIKRLDTILSQIILNNPKALIEFNRRNISLTIEDAKNILERIRQTRLKKPFEGPKREKLRLLEPKVTEPIPQTKTEHGARKVLRFFRR